MKVIRYKRQSKWQQPRKSPQLRVSSIKTKKNYFSLESFNLNGEFQKKANRLRLFFGRISGSLSSFSSKDRTRLFVVGGGCTLVNSLRETRYGVGRMKMSRESKNENGCKHGQSEQMCHVQLCGFSSCLPEHIVCLFPSSLYPSGPQRMASPRERGTLYAISPFAHWWVFMRLYMLCASWGQIMCTIDEGGKTVDKRLTW